MTFVTTRPNRCKHLWLSLLQKLIVDSSFSAVATKAAKPSDDLLYRLCRCLRKP